MSSPRCRVTLTSSGSSAKSCAALSESPPSSKKSSWTPMGSTPTIFCQSWTSVSFQRVAGFDVRRVVDGTGPIWVRKGASVDLARRCDRETTERYESCGHQVAGHVARRQRPQISECWWQAGTLDVCDELLDVTRGSSDDGGRVMAGCCSRMASTSRWLDPKPPDLELVVESARNLKDSVRGALTPRSPVRKNTASGHRIWHEALRRQRWLIVVTGGDPRATDDQLARAPVLHWAEILVDDRHGEPCRMPNRGSC